MADTLDWNILSLPGLQDEIIKQAGSIAAMFPTFNTSEDLEQEALIWCATHPDEVRKLHAGGDGLLGIRIWSRLQHKVETEARHQSNTIGIHRLYEKGE